MVNSVVYIVDNSLPKIDDDHEIDFVSYWHLMIILQEEGVDPFNDNFSGGRS